MKGKILIAVCVLVCIVQSCIPQIGGDDPEKKQDADESKFLVLLQNADGNIGEGSSLSLLTVTNGVPVYEHLQFLYPSRNLRDNVDINNGRVAIGLHYDFNTDGKSRTSIGAWFDFDGTTWEELPLLSSGSENRYSYLDVGTVKVSESGHVFYLSSSNDSWYHDQYRASLVRYDPETKELKQANSLDGFVLEQPERGLDTETAIHGTLFFPSNDGRYVYGYARAFGVDFGSYHWDYEILYRYDFETDSYTRLGNAADKHVGILGITSDRQYLAYSTTVDGVYYRNLVHTSSNTVIETTLSGGQAYNNSTRWNGSGYCSGETNNTIGIYNMLAGTSHDISTPTRPNLSQYDADGNRIYFMIDDYSGKFLCRTSDNSAEATIDTLCMLRSDVDEFLVIK